MPGSRSTELAAYLEQVAADRARLCLPVVAFALIASLALSDRVGVPLSATVWIVNAGALVVACGLYVLLRFPIACRAGHAIAAITWLIAPVTTLTSEWETGTAQLSMLVLVELVTSAVQVSTPYMLATTLLVFGVWVPLGLRDGGPEPVFQIVAVGVGVITGFTTHLLLRRSLVQAEELRLEERRTREQFVHAQRMEAVGTLAAGLAHDMNNILAGILGYAEIMRDEATDSSVREDCSHIVQAAQRGASLTRSLLAFGRRGQYHREPIALREILDSIAPLLTRTLPKSITVERIVDDDVVVDADDAQLGQVLLNLCLNGADAMDGAGHLEIRCGTQQLDATAAAKLGLEAGVDTWAVLSVRDSGRGMDEETRRRIFEPFFTTKPLGKGTGLGLAMVYGAVQGHDGAIHVETSPGKGTTFVIYLPAVDAMPTPAPIRIDSGRFSRRHVVMIVDDEPVVRSAAARIIERLGVIVVCAASGEEALTLFEQRRQDISLVVLDMAMPGMGGAACFRALQRHASVPVLIASGYALDHEAQDLLAAGAIGFVDKPFTAATLCEHVERALTGRFGAVASA